MGLTDILRLCQRFAVGTTLVSQSLTFGGCTARQDIPTAPPAPVRDHQLTLELLNDFYELSDESDDLIVRLLTDAVNERNISLGDFYTAVSGLRELSDIIAEMNSYAVRRDDACLDNQEGSDLISRNVRRLLWLNTRTTDAERENRFYDLAIILSRLPEHSECDGLSFGMRLPSGTEYYRRCMYSRSTELQTVMEYNRISTHLNSLDYDSTDIRQYIEALEELYELSENRHIHIYTAREIRADVNSAARRLLIRYVRELEEYLRENIEAGSRENMIRLAELIARSDPLVRCLEDEPYYPAI
jgi:hypothetical protein